MHSAIVGLVVRCRYRSLDAEVQADTLASAVSRFLRQHNGEFYIVAGRLADELGIGYLIFLELYLMQAVHLQLPEARNGDMACIQNLSETRNDGDAVYFALELQRADLDTLLFGLGKVDNVRLLLGYSCPMENGRQGDGRSYLILVLVVVDYILVLGILVVEHAIVGIVLGQRQHVVDYPLRFLEAVG